MYEAYKNLSYNKMKPAFLGSINKSNNNIIIHSKYFSVSD